MEPPVDVSAFSNALNDKALGLQPNSTSLVLLQGVPTYLSLSRSGLHFVPVECVTPASIITPPSSLTTTSSSSSNFFSSRKSKAIKSQSKNHNISIPPASSPRAASALPTPVAPSVAASIRSQLPPVSVYSYARLHLVLRPAVGPSTGSLLIIGVLKSGDAGKYLAQTSTTPPQLSGATVSSSTTSSSSTTTLNTLMDPVASRISWLFIESPHATELLHEISVAWSRVRLSYLGTPQPLPSFRLSPAKLPSISNFINVQDLGLPPGTVSRPITPPYSDTLRLSYIDGYSFLTATSYQPLPPRTGSRRTPYSLEFANPSAPPLPPLAPPALKISVATPYLSGTTHDGDPSSLRLLAETSVANALTPLLSQSPAVAKEIAEGTPLAAAIAAACPIVVSAPLARPTTASRKPGAEGSWPMYAASGSSEGVSVLAIVVRRPHMPPTGDVTQDIVIISAASSQSTSAVDFAFFHAAHFVAPSLTLAPSSLVIYDLPAIVAATDTLAWHTAPHMYKWVHKAFNLRPTIHVAMRSLVWSVHEMISMQDPHGSAMAAPAMSPSSSSSDNSDSDSGSDSDGPSGSTRSSPPSDVPLFVHWLGILSDAEAAIPPMASALAPSACGTPPPLLPYTATKARPRTENDRQSRLRHAVNTAAVAAAVVDATRQEKQRSKSRAILNAAATTASIVSAEAAAAAHASDHGLSEDEDDSEDEEDEEKPRGLDFKEAEGQANTSDDASASSSSTSSPRSASSDIVVDDAPTSSIAPPGAVSTTAPTSKPAAPIYDPNDDGSGTGMPRPVAGVGSLRSKANLAASDSPNIEEPDQDQIEADLGASRAHRLGRIGRLLWRAQKTQEVKAQLGPAPPTSEEKRAARQAWWNKHTKELTYEEQDETSPMAADPNYRTPLGQLPEGITKRGARAWKMRLAAYLSYCLDGHITASVTLASVAAFAMGTDGTSSQRTNASALLEYALHARLGSNPYIPYGRANLASILQTLAQDPSLPLRMHGPTACVLIRTGYIQWVLQERQAAPVYSSTLVALLRDGGYSSHAPLLAVAATATATLAHTRVRPSLLGAGVAPALLSLISRASEPTLALAAIAATRNLTAGSSKDAIEAKKAIATNPLFWAVLKSVRAQPPKVSGALCGLLKHVISVKEVRELSAAHRVPQLLASLAFPPDPLADASHLVGALVAAHVGAKTATIGALWNLAADKVIATALVDEGILPPLLQLIHSTRFGCLLRVAAGALMVLMNANDAVRSKANALNAVQIIARRIRAPVSPHQPPPMSSAAALVHGATPSSGNAALELWSTFDRVAGQSEVVDFDSSSSSKSSDLSDSSEDSVPDPTWPERASDAGEAPLAWPLPEDVASPLLGALAILIQDAEAKETARDLQLTDAIRDAGVGVASGHTLNIVATLQASLKPGILEKRRVGTQRAAAAASNGATTVAKVQVPIGASK